ncbi:DEAD/DEAH box helicase family protein [Mesobacillus sp. S13]|uniref:DEAD/DEAH box helicase family protein n=1 Tax=Mesobacillus sp. S13 TaxID=2880221 RepID=UPI001CF5A358|nr:DEAD/DEAH box helicase family protein [Mesobacillus sp. S13]
MGALNLQWVSDSIGYDYKRWKQGDTVLISAQTGTGKTYFIKEVLLDHMDSGQRLLFVCNRTNLKRQLKKDLLKKYKQPIPETLNELDDVTTIADKVTITSYHAISNAIQQEIYDPNASKSDFNLYDYIVFDECHFIFSDGNFNNKTRFAYKKVVHDYYPHIVKIFISATMHEIKEPIIRSVEKIKNNGFGLDVPTVHEYSTGNDYSYVKPLYFSNIDSIINLIKNDSSNEKWLVFISDINRDGNKLLEELGEDRCSLIKSGTKSDELNYIINNSKFTKKVLVSTKAMDNGINIKDSKLKNIVIMTWDRITFIQMLGRKRIDIDNPEEVNLYIPTRFKKSFLSKLKTYRQKQVEVELLDSNKMEFYKKYDNDLKDFNGMNDVFYRDVTTGEIKHNLVGCKRLYEDIKFAEHMINAFDIDKKFAYIHEQLSWLGISDDEPEENLIEDVVIKEEVISLEMYLDTIAGQKLFDEEQHKLSDLIIKELITLSSQTDYRTKKLKPSTLESIVRNQLELPFAVSKPKQETSGVMRKKRYIIITRIK